MVLFPEAELCLLLLLLHYSLGDFEVSGLHVMLITRWNSVPNGTLLVTHGAGHGRAASTIK